jgi:signal transduction histidine kinase
LIKVTDYGLGIGPEDLKKLFEPFYVTKNKQSRVANPSGNSLGLSISRNIARGLLGDLTVESELEKGSTFTFKLEAEFWINI